jgi:predicted ATP-binding protein involved in virulence
MPFSISKMILHNRAPFEHIELSFAEKGISILSAVNGGGKTTILSHIADAWYEMVREAYSREFEGKETKYYRVSSQIFSLNKNKPSYVLIRFKNTGRDFEYLDLRGKVDQTTYDEIMPDDTFIKYNAIKEMLEQSGNIKYCSEVDQKIIEQIFLSNLITYFPSYRHEQPGYLNDPFKIRLEYGLAVNFSGYLRNPIEIISNLPQLANWLMDVVLDHSLSQKSYLMQILVQNINLVFSKTLSVKAGQAVSIGIGQRMDGATRIQIGERDNNGNWTKAVYPSIFNMSSGESALICLFGEIVRQFDRIRPGIPIINATGTVLIDEIDKHLHIRMQKDVLPKLLQLFPNVQFIISSHSPFVLMGLEETATTNSRTQIIDLDNDGVVADLSITRVFAEGYDAMIEKNKQYKNMYDAIKAKEKSAKLQIVSEGYNGEHIKQAIMALDDSLLEQLEFPYSDKTGKDQLKHAYDSLFNSNPQTKYLFIWDCDYTNTSLSENEHFYWFIFAKNYTNDKVKKGVENLYPVDVFKNSHYSERKETDDYGAEKTIQTFDKNAFLETVKADTTSSHFENYRPLIEKIKSILIPSNEAENREKE